MGSTHSHSTNRDEERMRRRYEKLLAAVQSTKLTRVKSLCRKGGVSLPAMTEPLSGNSCILMASQLGSRAMILYAIHQGCDVNQVNPTGTTALMLASALGHLHVVHTLLEHRADCGAVNRNGNSSLLLAAKGGHSEIVLRLLAAGSDPACRDRHGNSPLILACQEGHTDTVRTLLHLRGYNPSRGCELRKPQCGSEFADCGEEEHATPSSSPIDINAANDAGETALIVSCRNEAHLDIARMLINCGGGEGGGNCVDVNARDERGKTALCYLLMLMGGAGVGEGGGQKRREEWQETINLLVQSGADLRLAMSATH